MRSIALYCLALLVACAASAGPAVARSGLDAELQACAARMMASPEWHALKGYLAYGNGPNRKATPNEAQQMTRLHHEHLRPCQEIEVEIAGETHPSLAPLYNAAAAKANVEIARLVRLEITWAEYSRNGAAIRKDLNARLEAARRALGLPSLNGLDRVRPN
jgi:hypothetical protein